MNINIEVIDIINTDLTVEIHNKFLMARLKEEKLRKKEEKLRKEKEEQLSEKKRIKKKKKIIKK